MLRRVRKFISPFWIRLKVRNKRKIFCIGQNKTGTTSLQILFRDLGFAVGKQRDAEHLIDFYADGNFEPIVQYCKSAQVFQDFPFSYPETYKHLDMAYPNSKFILSVRDSAEQWYNSYVNFFTKITNCKSAPTASELKTKKYLYKGWLYKCVKYLFKTPDEDLFNKDQLQNHYNRYNEDVLNYFKDRPSDIIIVNLAIKDDFKRLMNFLEIDTTMEDFPWVNKTVEYKHK